jgi:DNA-binding PadR family transcriptional regulator
MTVEANRGKLANMKHQQPASDLSDLEGAGLAAVARMGGATRYQVAADFADSPSEFWSGSAGAVYPMMDRLAARGLLIAEEGATGRRRKTVYRLSEQGRAAMLAWLLDARRGVGLGYDPLRTRVANLHLASPEQRAAFLAEVEALTLEGPVFGDDAARNHIHATWIQARRHWLQLLKATKFEP